MGRWGAAAAVEPLIVGARPVARAAPRRRKSPCAGRKPQEVRRAHWDKAARPKGAVPVRAIAARKLY